ncbi:MAG: NfeD family protein [Deltaproteobacteria bacterium]|nr:NfeD family protein [Deltaproteobacteria bacterium]
MTALEIVYVACFVLGLAYAVFSTLFGDSHAGHVDMGLDSAHDITGHVDTQPDANSGSIHFSPLSPVVIAMFVTAFGAAGMICLKVFSISAVSSLPIAVIVGVGAAAITFYLFVLLFSKTQGSSESQISQVLGREAEVITPIPAEGVGEIAYVSKGARYTAPARSVERQEIRSHMAVRIHKIVGSTFWVKPL